jgi:hypothetical protein
MEILFKCRFFANDSFPMGIALLDFVEGSFSLWEVLSGVDQIV